MVWQQEHRLVYQDFLERYRVIVFFFLGLFLFLSFRLFHLQVIRGKYYRALSERQRTHIIQERAPRGIVFDRNGEILVGNRTVFVAIFYPFSQGKSLPQLSELEKLKDILKRTNITSRVKKGWHSGQTVRLADDLSRSEMFRLKEQRLMLPGISVVEEARRNYFVPEASSHLMGYLSEISNVELERLAAEGYKMGDWVGRRGLEQIYDSKLRGQDGGWQIEVDALGRQTRLVSHIQPIPGNNIYTTLDANLQELAAEALKNSPSGRGSVVAIDPRTGAIRAMVSSPGFDPSLSFSREFSRYLVDKENMPLFNRTLQGVYPPGSIFKIITFVGALMEGGIDPEKKFECKGSFDLGNQTFKCWEKKGHGKMDLKSAFANSCNVYFYQVGLQIGPEIIEKYAREFGLGELTGINLGSEQKGLVPNNEWKIKNIGSRWQSGDTVNMSIGQGALAVTPLQMAVMISIVANNGIFYKPYFVERISTPEGNILAQYNPRKKSEIKLPGNVFSMLREALEEVVSNGTGRACYFSDLKVAGKSGTAQNPHGTEHAWFVAYAPAVNPELAVSVMVENGGGGGSIAAPIARQIFERYFMIKKSVIERKNKESIDRPAGVSDTSASGGV